MKKIVYSKKYHAEALLDILEMEDPCGLCPRRHGHKGKFENYLTSLFDSAEYYIVKNNACDICINFVGTDNCPCCQLGHNEAIKRTWIALEEKGYI